MAVNVPPTMRPERFAAALAAFEQIVGPQWVFHSPEDLALYRDAYSPYWGELQERMAAAALAPATADEVQALVRVAHRLQIPLHPISTGRNLGYGGAAPIYSGSVILDLKRLNRILEINAEGGYALLEPGVSYFDLYRHLNENRIPLWVDCAEPGWGSVVANALERGIGHGPMCDHFASLCGLEIVMADGELLRTGLGAVPDSSLWARCKYGLGPYLDGLFSQSSLGIVTKAGVHLYREPEAVQLLTVTAHHYDDLDEFLQIVQQLRDARILNADAPIVSPLMSAVSDADVAALLSRTDDVAAGQWDQLATAKALPLYALSARLFGPANVVAAQMEHLKQRFSAIAGISFTDARLYRTPLNAAAVDATDRTVLGLPNLLAFNALATTPNHGHYFFGPNIPLTGEAVRLANRIFMGVFRQSGQIRGWVGGNSCFPKTLTMLYPFLISEEVARNRANREIVRKLILVAAEHGWAEYRTPVAFMDAAMNSYSFNDHALRRLNETLKDALDPRGILSPGKNGIWPKTLRNRHGYTK